MAFGEQILSSRSKPHLQKYLVNGNANKKLDNLSPFVKMAESYQRISVPIESGLGTVETQSYMSRLFTVKAAVSG